MFRAFAALEPWAALVMSATGGALVVGFLSGANAKDHRHSSAHHIREAPHVEAPYKPALPPRSQGRGDIYDSDAGGRHFYTNPDRDFFGPNVNCGYSC
jgi:hypothetical protein